MFKIRWSFLMFVLACAVGTASAAPQDDLAFAVYNSARDKTSEWVVTKLVTLQVGDKCWAKVLDPGKTAAVGLIATHTRTIERYAKLVTGDDWSHIENQGANNKDANRAIVEKMIEEFKPKFHLTVAVEGDDCEASNRGLWLKYVSAVTRHLEKHPPKSGKAFVTITATTKVRSVTATVADDGATIRVEGPRDIEPSFDWSGTIEKALLRVSAKQ